jgi:hypothetical protein
MACVVQLDLQPGRPDVKAILLVLAIRLHGIRWRAGGVTYAERARDKLD